MSPTFTRFAWIAFGLATLLTLFFALAPAVAGGMGGPLDHSLAFLTLGFLFRLAAWRLHFVTLLLILAAFGGAIELLQGTPLINRDIQIGDFVIDFIAATIGLAIGSGFIRLAERRTRRG